MRLARFLADGRPTHGCVLSDCFIEFDNSWEDSLENATIEGGPLDESPNSVRWPLDRCELIAPIASNGRGIICAGMNYAAHAMEARDGLAHSTRSAPPLFYKLPSAVAAPNERISTYRHLTTELDWEVELGVVIGKDARGVGPEEVANVIAGYTMVLDITARDLQKEHGQWFLGKNLESSSPVGPWVVTRDEIEVVPALDVELSVNGQTKQKANTADLIWGISELITLASSVFPLKRGDVIATGSPEGVGFTRQPPEFLASGDELSAKIEKIGELHHVVE